MQDISSKQKVIPSVKSVVDLQSEMEFHKKDGVILETRDSGKCYDGASV
jgi:hypothetical protein